MEKPITLTELKRYEVESWSAQYEAIDERMKDMFELGFEYVDKVTGFKGFAIGHVKYITGCYQVLLQPRGDGKTRPESEWFDEARVVFTENKERIEIVTRANLIGFDKEPSKI